MRSSALLEMVGIPTQVVPTTIFLNEGGLFLTVYLSWNSVGWRSFILCAASLVTGLQGLYTRSSKIETSVVRFL